MSVDRAHRLISVLRHPEAAFQLTLHEWDTLIRSARRANLLPRVAMELERRGLLPRVPEAPRAHLEAARVLADAQSAAVRREVVYVARALEEIGVRVVLLKGAAYLLAGLSAARGRMFSDVDILVPAERLSEVEARLMLHGWSSAKTSAYDQRYYRRWMHELPPFKHNSRQTVLDVHHAILPTTARLKPDSRKLLAAATPITDRPDLAALAPVDMVLHSAAHLFCNEDVGNSLRDLVDLDSLLRELGEMDDFWPRLVARAIDLDLTRPLYYALRYAGRILGTPIPTPVAEAADVGRPPPWVKGLMDTLFARSFLPGAPREGAAALARLSLYVRAHWLRMPPLLLTYHLAVKAFRRERESPG